MSNTQQIDIEEAIRETYRLWSAGKRKEHLDYLRQLAPNGYSVEFVGGPVEDGFKSTEGTWEKYGTKTELEVQLVIAKGNEAAARVNNIMHTDNGSITIPSINTYKLEDGRLSIRYFMMDPN